PPGEREPVFLHRSTSEIFCRIRAKSQIVSANLCHRIVLSGLSASFSCTAVPKKNNVFWANYDASNHVESSGIVGKNFPFDLRIDALHRFEPRNRVELARGIAMAQEPRI